MFYHIVHILDLFTVNKCLVCTEIANEQCRNPAAGQFLEECSTSNPGCITRIVGGHIIRGCLNSLSIEDILSCDSTICFPCEENECNRQSVAPSTTPPPNKRLLCHQCVGQEDISCAGKIISAPTECPKNVINDQCYIARPLGDYERGCLSSTKRCEYESCQKCSTNGCNSGDYNSANNVYSMSKMITFSLLSVVIVVFNK